MSQKSILLVELDPQLSVALELFLRGRGYNVNPAATPAEAMRLAIAEPPGTVLIGNLPDSTDAGTLAQRLRAILGATPASIVVMAHTVDDVPGADLIIPTGAHPRAILDGLRSARRRGQTRPIPLDRAG